MKRHDSRGHGEPHERDCSSTQANTSSRYGRVDDSVLRDDRSPRFYDGSGCRWRRRIPPDDDGEISSLAAIGAGSDVRARHEGGIGTVAQTCHRERKAAEEWTLSANPASHTITFLGGEGLAAESSRAVKPITGSVAQCPALRPTCTPPTGWYRSVAMALRAKVFEAPGMSRTAKPDRSEPDLKAVRSRLSFDNRLKRQSNK
jgi:hypothetical protein